MFVYVGMCRHTCLPVCGGQGTTQLSLLRSITVCCCVLEKVFHWSGSGQLASGLCLPPLPSAEVTNVPPHDSGPHVRYTNFTNGTTSSVLWVGFSFVCFLIECCFHCTIFSRILIIKMTKSLTSRNF